MVPIIKYVGCLLISELAFYLKRRFIKVAVPWIVKNLIKGGR